MPWGAAVTLQTVRTACEPTMGKISLPALPVAFAAALAVSAPTVAADEKDTASATGQARHYASCMARASANPTEAYREAVAWRDSGGGRPARHCVAVALLGLGLYQDAARKLEDIARKADTGGVTRRGELLAQAANAWLIAGKPEAAYANQTAALKIRPDDVELLIDRSISLATLVKYWEAVDDLNRALELQPGRIDALIFRATAYRRLDTIELADEDIRRALAVSPDNPDGLLERGNIRRLKGDRKGARGDWIRVLALAPGAPAGAAARRNLERLDAGKK